MQQTILYKVGEQVSTAICAMCTDRGLRSICDKCAEACTRFLVLDFGIGALVTYR
jgi:hypothetical protein